MQRAASLLLLAGALLMALKLAGIEVLPDPLNVNLEQAYATPQPGLWLGADDLGRDLLARLLAGVAVSLAVGFGVLLMAAAIGIPLGMLAGWKGGWVDALMTKLCEVVLSFPGILLALALAALLGGSLLNVVVALGVLGWVGFCRLARVEMQILRSQPFTAAARLGGVQGARLFYYHLLPNLQGPLRVEALLVMAGSMVAEAGLSFLGLGIPAPNPSLGGMLRDGLRDVLIAPHLVVIPAVVLIGLTLMLHLLAKGRLAPKRAV